jgi:hypothetical protein
MKKYFLIIAILGCKSNLKRLNRLACHSKAMVVSAGKKLPKLN